MTVTFKGLDCLADSELDEYMDYYMTLQAEIPWASQVKYGYYTIYFGCAFVGFAMFKHVYYKFRDSRSSQSNWLTSLIDIVTSYSRFVGYKQIPASLSYYTSLPISVSSSLFLMASTLFLGLYCFVPHYWYRGCRGFGSPPLATRGGVMATALTPFIYILAGKANFVTLVTGISYEKLNYIHQYVAVAALVLSIVHTIPFIHQPLVEGGFENLKVSFAGDILMWNGLAPLISLIILCTLSKSWIRKVFYEGFWHLHWIMGMVYCATLTWHVYGLLGTTNYMWSAIAFWGAQVIYRLIMKTCLKPNMLFLKPSEAKLFRLPGSKAYQVNVKNRGLTWRPGQHVYLRFKSRVLDNHPFSVSNLPNQTDDELKFIIVPKRGLTKSLYDKIDSVLTESVFLDGPYGGCSRDHNSFENVYLLATGSGITATISFLTDLTEKIKSGANTVTKQINFVWVVRYAEDIKWFKTEISKALECEYVNVKIYITHEEESADSKEDCVKKPSDESEIEDKHIEFDVIYQKPNFSYIVSTFKYSLGRRNFFVSSGSDSMKIAVSSGVSDLQPFVFNGNTHVQEVFLHTESFGW